MGESKFRFVFAGIFLVTFLFLIAYAFAGMTFVVNGGINATAFRAEPNITTVFNFTVNQTLDSLGNFTIINVTLPAGFTYQVGSQASSAVQNTFINSSTSPVVITWNNSGGLVMNLTNLTNFKFNATANNLGTFRFIIRSYNSTGLLFEQNLSVVVNDTIPSNITYASPTNDSETNLTTGTTTITANATVTDGVSLDSVSFILQNGTQLTITNTSVFKWVGNVTTSQSVIFNNLSDGVYYVNVTVNDTNNNINVTSTRIFRIDSTKPTASFGCSPSTVNKGETTTCTCTGSDATSGVRSTEYTTNPDTTLTGTNLQTQCTVTDNSGNSQTFTTSYNVVSSGGSSGGGSSGGGSGSSTVSWTQTIAQDANELSQTAPVSQALGSSHRVKLKIGGEAHTVGVKSIGSSSITIQVASTPQDATLNIGDTKKFELNGDGFYDLSVTLKSITAGKANLDMVALHEAVPATTTQTTTGETPSTTGTNSGAETTSSSSWVIWVAVLLVVVVVAVIFLRKRRK